MAIDRAKQRARVVFQYIVQTSNKNPAKAGSDCRTKELASTPG